MTIVLGLDTATGDAVVALTRSGEPVREASVPPGEDGRPRHSQVLLGEIERCVEAGGGWETVERIAVGVGPGSFTGLRIGIATARGLAQARAVRIAPIGTLAALARGMSELPTAKGHILLPVIDARRSEFFAALYERDGTEIWAPFVAPPDRLEKRLAKLDSTPLAAGDGALRLAAELKAAGATVAPPQDEVHRVAARHVCALGEVATAASPDQIEPLYLRPPDAKRWLERDREEPGG